MFPAIMKYLARKGAGSGPIINFPLAKSQFIKQSHYLKLKDSFEYLVKYCNWMTLMKGVKHLFAL